MTVKLPGTYTGEQILGAFKRACAVVEDKRFKYSVADDSVKYRYEPSVKITPESSGVVLTESVVSFGKRFLLFGEKVEFLSFNSRIKLLPVSLVQEYSEVKVENFRAFGGSYMGLVEGRRVEPGQVSFNTEIIEKLIGNFYQELQALPVSN